MKLNSHIKYNIEQGASLGRLSLVLFVISLFMLEGNYGQTSINIGNLFVAGAGLLSLLVTLHLSSRGHFLMPGLMVHDFIFALYIVLLFISSIYSQNPNPTITIVGAAYHFLIWAGAFALSKNRTEYIIRIYLITATLVALASFASTFINSTYAFQPFSRQNFLELRGVMSHQLRLGLAMSIGIGIFIIAVLNKDIAIVLPKYCTLVIIILVTCSYFAWARLYSIQMIGALAITIFLGSRGLSRYLSGTVIFIALFLAATFWEPAMMLFDENSFDSSLSGRTLAWERTLQIHQENPWFGFGYATYDNSIFDYAFGNWRPAHPHNSYLQAYFETGYTGLFLVIMTIYTHHSVGKKYTRILGKYSYSSFVVWLAILGSVTGSNYAGKPTLLIAFLLLIVGAEARSYELHRSPKGAVGD